MLELEVEVEVDSPQAKPLVWALESARASVLDSAPAALAMALESALAF